MNGKLSVFTWIQTRTGHVACALLLLLTTCACGADAQTDSDFAQFRQRMLDDYQSFRGNVLDDYARFLDTVWVNYNLFAGKKLYPDNKPKSAPEAPFVDITPVTIIPVPDVPEPTAPIPVPEPAMPELPKILPAVPAQKYVTFDFYSLKAKASEVRLASLEGMDGHDVSVLWKRFQDGDVYDKVSSALNQYRIGCNFNDWLTFQLVHDYADALYPGDDNSSAVLTHYLLANMGFDVRIGKGRSDRFLLLIPFRQMVYARPYLELDGVKYFVFMYDGGKDVSNGLTSLSTYDMPKGADFGSSFNLIVGSLMMPDKGEKSYELTDEVMTLKGTVPETPIDVAKGFVQTEIPVYAKSCMSTDFKNELLKQVREQLQGLSEEDAVNRLLHFMQYAFNYATDDDQFGYEKPFFIEENFYYPSNDCEDRAILLTFIVRNVLGLDVHLLHFPGHEATAICFTDQTLEGDGYVYEGKKYLICDPTYIGAGIGRCMSQYEGVKPEIEL